jgi:DNA-binding protein HU-beta
MNKQELIDAIAKESKLTKVDAKKALDAMTKSVTKSLKKGEKVILVGYGTFSVVKRAARMGKNPRTGQAIKIPAKKAVKFKAGSELAKAVEK